MNFQRKLESFPRAKLFTAPTPLERLDRISNELDIDLWIKRDDLTSLGLGGNKIRILESYMGDALKKGADTILITGATQSNYVRAAAAASKKLGLKPIVQLEHRVENDHHAYKNSGNVLLGKLFGSEFLSYPLGEDENGADNALFKKAEQISAEGGDPYVIPLGFTQPPKGALGYVRAGLEILEQKDNFDIAITASGSGQTHTGLLAGLRQGGFKGHVFGSCVRRGKEIQRTRIQTMLANLQTMFGMDLVAKSNDVLTWDDALFPGYGEFGPLAQEALLMAARLEGLVLDPIYTAKSFAAILGLLREGVIKKGDKVLYVHTGGQPGVFGYESLLTDFLNQNSSKA